jgi:uncharacterized protein
MIGRSRLAALALVALTPIALPLVACSSGGGAAGDTVTRRTIPLTITGGDGKSHKFLIEAARTSAEQARGLMFRTDLTDDGGMLFYPYPPEGGPPKAASFWMKNTPSPLDIIFIRTDGTIARIASAVPFDQTPIPSGEPVSAVLELKGGRTVALGIGEGDRVRWPH